MIRCVETRWTAWYRRTFAGIATGGGAAMLVIAALARNSASVPLLIIGTGWLAVGLLSLQAGRRYAREIVLDGRLIRFISPTSETSVDAADIIQMGYAALDPNRMGPISVRTSAHGTIKTAPRLTGMIDLLIELRQLNPDISYRRM